MSTPRGLTHASSLAFALLLLSTAATAGPWMPLSPGTRWEYQGDAGGHQVESITGTTTLHGRVVAIKYHAEGVDTGLENYWLLDADGSVLLAGYFSPAQGSGLVYEPPIRFVPVPPVLGPQPFVLTAFHDFATDAVIVTVPVRYDVTQDLMLSLPAGVYHAYGVGRYISLPEPNGATGAQFSLDGRLVMPRGKSIYYFDTSDWFSEGVGEVQYNVGELYQLRSFDLPTATVRSTWSAIKHLYR